MSYTKYVLLAQPRTGSTWLNQMLALHPRICARGEVFNPQSGKEEKKRAQVLRHWLRAVEYEAVRPSQKIRKKTTAAEVLDIHLWHSGYRSDVQAVGFKLLHYQMAESGRFPNLKKQLRERLSDLKLILLDRENLLQRHVSNLIAKKMKRWNVRDEAQRREPPTVWIDPNELEEAFRWHDHLNTELDEFAARAMDVYELSYEELVRRTDVHWQNIQRFLDVQVIDLPKTSTIKLETRHMRHAVENYDELSFRFAGTRWGRYFDEYPPVSFARPRLADGAVENANGSAEKNGRVARPVREMRLNIDPKMQPDFSSEHRSGWSFALKSLAELNQKKGVIVDTFVERTFSWHLKEEATNGRIPFRKPWIGFLHNPPRVPQWHDYRHSPEVIIHRPVFQDSLKNCLGIFVLSNYLQRWLTAHLDVPIERLVHPTDIPDLRFSMDAFLKNKNKRVVQVGWWLRRLHSIHQLPVRSFQKTMLTVKNSYFPYTVEREKKILGLDDLDESDVQRMQFLPNGKYDQMLSQNLVFCHLYDSSANNTVIECIARNTPILVNPLPAVVEYLGEEYPFYFNTLEEAAEKAEDKDTVRAAHEYLANMPKEVFSQEAFRESFLNARF